MKLALLALCVTFATTNAHALECTVDDPTGTPLNVRNRPNGPIVGALHNGAAVFVSDLILDGSGRRWAKIVPIEEGKSGWVFREYLMCTSASAPTDLVQLPARDVTNTQNPIPEGLWVTKRELCNPHFRDKLR
jgi:hypothetical protein